MAILNSWECLTDAFACSQECPILNVCNVILKLNYDSFHTLGREASYLPLYGNSLCVVVNFVTVCGINGTFHLKFEHILRT